MSEEKIEFSKKHPAINFILGLVIIFTGLMAMIFVVFCCYIIIKDFLLEIITFTSTLDTVVVVALITGTISLLGVIVSSVVAKIIDYKTSRNEYLAMKREVPYGQFIDMVYKLLKKTKEGTLYT